MSDTLRTPSQSCSTSTAISSGASTRSGARITQTCRVSSNFSLAWRGSTGRLASLTLMLRPAMGSSGLLYFCFNPAGARMRPAECGPRHRHDTARRGEDAFGRFHVSGVEAETFGQLQPALDAAFGADIAVMVFDAVPPFQPRGAVAEARDHHRVLDRDGALVIIAVQRPGLHLALVQLAAVQEPVKRMQIVVAHRADVAEGGFQFFGAVQGRAF